MSRSPVGKIISSADSGYSDVWDAWVENGRPHQFDRMGEWGGAIYRCYDTGADEPDFYQAASLPETLYAEDSSSTPYQKGWYHSINRDYMRIQARWTHDGRIRIKKPEIPNEL